jgi:type I restriction enzyme S subunit
VKTQLFGWKKALLGDIAAGIQYGYTESSTLEKVGPRFLRITDIQNGKVDWNSVPYCKCDDLEKYRLQSGDILFARTGATTGKSFLIRDCPDSVFASYLIRVQLSKEVSPGYIYQFFQTPSYWSHITQFTTGSTQGGFNASKLAEIAIPLPPLPIQKQIAAILEKADAAREKRRGANQLTEQFLQSAFLEMFGDPVTNPKGWEKVKIAELGLVQTGNTPPRIMSKYYGNHIEWIKTDNIIPHEVFPTKSLEGLSEEGMRVGRVARKGSILVTCIAGSPTTIGNASLTNRKVAFNQQINAVTPFDDVDPWFLYGLFVVNKRIVQKSTTLGMKRIITKTRFENMIGIKPPLVAQQKFAALVEKVESLRAKQRESEKELENLFNSLMQRAFKGELEFTSEPK